jgi:hypothetical protein
MERRDMLSKRLLLSIQDLINQEVSHASLPDLVARSRERMFPGSQLPTDSPGGPNRLPAGFTVTEEDVIDMLEILRKNTYLESLDLSNLHLTILPDAVINFSGLRHSVLSAILFSDLMSRLG